MMTKNKLGASFRDPSGFLYRKDGRLYRQVNHSYQGDYDLLMGSGLYQSLVEKGRLIPHQEVDVKPEIPSLAYKIIEPDMVTFISYPYEWSFNQLKDAALLTLNIQKRAMKYGMSLKDASAYNIQFQKGKPVLIDTLSFEAYEEGKPWVAYRQFCQHFLAPLALMAKVDIRLNQLMRIYIDGIPLDMASELLPWGTRLNLGLGTHIHIHASAQKKYADQAVEKPERSATLNRQALEGLIESLRSTVKALSWKPVGTEWTDYYDATNYTNDAFSQKRDIVKNLAAKVKPALVWDLGANTGVFSQAAIEIGSEAVAYDIDPGAVDKNYLDCKARKETKMLPLLLDLTNPSPALGWANDERMSFAQRGPANLVMALALVHHLAISNNVPLPMLADYLSQCGKWLIIEFVPKEDSQVQRLLTTRKDIFDHYNQPDFEEAFSEVYHIRETIPVPGTRRTLYLMEVR